MHRIRWAVFYLLPVVVWMFLIFGFSSDAASFQRSSRIIGPFMHWLFPAMQAATVNEIVFVVRKCAHVTEYAILALLVFRCRRKFFQGEAGFWEWPLAGGALWVAVLYAATDEFHQTFVPSREGCLRDVLIDSSGAFAGLFLLWMFGRWRKIW